MNTTLAESIISITAQQNPAAFNVNNQITTENQLLHPNSENKRSQRKSS